MSVETFYQNEYSKPLESEFLFAYRITIFNGSDRTVQLLRRHWIIKDSNGITHEVEGEGVVGKQPVLYPGESHRYVSGCNLKTSVGKMSGSYLMQRINDKQQFFVKIPTFKLIAPQRLN